MALPLTLLFTIVVVVDAIIIRILYPNDEMKTKRESEREKTTRKFVVNENSFLSNKAYVLGMDLKMEKFMFWNWYTYL